MTYQSKTVSVLVDAPHQAIYEFARSMENLPKWPSGLASGVQQEGGKWCTESPMGRVGVEMAPENPFGVLDHVVTLPDGQTVLKAMRVSPAGDGNVLTFVVLRMPGVDAQAFTADVAQVKRDLRTLKALMEQ